MPVIGGHTANLSPDDTQTAIDEVMYETFTREEVPGFLSAQDSWFFHTSPTDSIAFIYDEDSNVGEFEETGEQEEVITTSTRIGNTTTKRITKYTKEIPISWEAFKTSQKGKREEIGRQVGDRAKVTQDRLSIVETYGDFDTGTYNTTPDGDAPGSNSHTTLNSDTIDNLETGALNADNLWTTALSLMRQRAQDFDAGGHMFEAIVVPMQLYKTARETLGSDLVPFSGENQLNIFSTDFGNVMLRGSVYLDSIHNPATNAATLYTVLGRNHKIERKVLSGLSTSMIEPQYTTTDSYVMRARFAESRFVGTWTALVVNSGTA